MHGAHDAADEGGPFILPRSPYSAPLLARIARERRSAAPQVDKDAEGPASLAERIVEAVIRTIGGVAGDEWSEGAMLDAVEAVLGARLGGRVVDEGEEPLKVTDGIEVPADVAWVHTVPVMHADRGRLLVPQERPARHVCEPPLLDREIRPPGAISGHPVQITPPEGSTWDCPACGRVWVVRTKPGEITSWSTTEWVPAAWWTAQRHRRRLQEGA